MNTPMPPNEREPLDRDERELADLYRRLPEARPGPELDARVLAEAERSVEPQGAHRAQRWLLGFGSAAALVLAAGLVWQQQRNSHPPAETAASEQRVSAPAATAAPVSGKRGTLVPIRVAGTPDSTTVAPRVALPERLESAPTAMPQGQQTAAKQRIIAQKPSASGMNRPNASHRSAADAAAPPENRAMSLAAPLPPPPPRVAEPITSDAQPGLKAMAAVPEEAVPAAPASTPSLPELVRQARAALKRHDRKQARQLALRIRKEYPDTRIPDDLAALLPASSASTNTP